MNLTFFKYIKLSRMVKQIVKNENLLDNLSKLYGFKFKIDWVGRIYAVINPLIKNGVFDQAGQIYGYDELEGRNTKDFINNWVMSRLDIAQEFIFEKDLFNILTYDLTKLDESENYLLVMSPIGYDNFKKTLKFLTGLFIGILLTSLSLILFI